MEHLTMIFQLKKKLKNNFSIILFLKMTKNEFMCIINRLSLYNNKPFFKVINRVQYAHALHLLNMYVFLIENKIIS